jgi:hypothetical protein
MSDAPAKDEWVRQVLGFDVSLSAQRGRDAKDSNVRGIAYPKLLLRWRGAQTALSASLNELSKDLLSRKEVTEDPRFKEVKKHVALLPTLVPTFGSELEDAIDAGINEGQGPRAGELAAKAITIIDAYRAQIASAAALKKLEAFAAADLSNSTPLGGQLDAALSELRAELSGAT